MGRRDKAWIKEIQRTVCPGCLSDRYNHGIGFIVGPERAPIICGMIDIPGAIRYSRREKQYYCKAKIMEEGEDGEV